MNDSSRMGDHRIHVRCLLKIVVVAAVVFITGAQSLEAQDDVSPTIEQIETWVDKLGADKFAVRQDAMRQLVKCRIRAIAPLMFSIRNGEPEARMRSVSVIGRLAIATEAVCQKAAQDALRELANSSEPEIRQLATRTIAHLGEAMQDRALADLRNLGAKVEIQKNAGNQSQATTTITIGPDFRGKTEDYALVTWFSGPLYLNLTGERINDQIINQISATPQIISLSISRATITNDALVTISRFDELSHLNLHYVPVDDKAMPSISQMTNLSRIQLYGTNVTREEATSVAKTLRTTFLDWRRGAFVGVNYNNDAEAPCTITRVVPGSSAEKYGVRQGDIIVQFAGKKIAVSTDFAGALTDFDPGDTVTVVVRRGEETVELNIVLGRFPDPGTN